jgi:hypothetical protein
MSSDSAIPGHSALSVAGTAASAASASPGQQQSPLVVLSSTPFAQQVVHLCQWVHPLPSALTLLCALLLTCLLHSGYTVVTLLAYLLMLQLLTCFVFINGSQLILKMKGQKPAAAKAAEKNGAAAGGGSTPVEQVEYISLSTLQNLLPVVHSSLNGVLNSAMFIIRCGENTLTLQVVAFLAVASILGRIFDGVTMFGLSSILLLSVPKLYALNKTQADKQIEKVTKMVQRVSDIVQSKVGGGEGKKQKKL